MYDFNRTDVDGVLHTNVMMAMVTMVMAVDNKLEKVDCDSDIDYFDVRTLFRFMFLCLNLYSNRLVEHF